MKVFDDFANELADLDSRVTIIQNPNHKQLANIMLDGVGVCTIPSGDIRDEVDPNYTITFPNGWVCKHRSRKEAIALVKNTIESIKTTEGKEIFYAKE